MTTGLWDRETFLENLRAIGARTYHDKHPFHVAMNEGRLSQDALRGWVANRFYYQQNIPVKDAAILSNCPLREVRRIWIHRILDHDGTGENEGGIEAWLRLSEACWSSFRRRCLCKFRSNPAVADCHCIIAHGTFRARSHGSTYCGFRKILFLDRLART